MTLFGDASWLQQRAALATGALSPLTASLREEIEPLLQKGFEIPAEKALLSRDGGRCDADGAQLRFDPYAPRTHECPRCGTRYSRERDYQWWITSYQLWLAERAVYAATLNALAPDPRLASLAERVLDGFADRYLTYPNRDNALGPTRPFFSTYLESIWLLQLCIALSLLESRSGVARVGDRVRERVIEPSVALIASFDEGDSNRQVWHNAALLAAGLLLPDEPLVHRAIDGRSGLRTHLARGVLGDGSWYEGENYHVFAHRGLWYGITIAEQRDLGLRGDLIEKFDRGFGAPLATALPDLTLPARRDSQYAISLRQWRFAESFELGLARRPDALVRSTLGRLYDDAVPRTDPGRWRSAADTQPHEPASALTRADLGWRSLLFACAALPALRAASPRSALLEEQGIAVFRRDHGRVFAALDYGQSGGGHGHPDRLNLLLMTRDDRVLDDMGTGSYVDPTLHWYRSTLAHNAPLFGGTSQRRVCGQLVAHEERGAAGWVDAVVPRDGLAAGVAARRAVIVMDDYLVDRLEWSSDLPVRAELPLHVDGMLHGVVFTPARLDGGSAAEDGFPFVQASERAVVPDETILSLTRDDRVRSWIGVSAAAEWWRARAPGPPGRGDRWFHLVRVHADAGSITSVWSWSAAVTGVTARDGTLVVHRGERERHEHARASSGWSIALVSGDARSSIDLGGARDTYDGRHGTAAAQALDASVPPVVRIRAGVAPVVAVLGESAYRRSEESWEEAGRPEARVALSASERHLMVTVSVTKADVTFRASDAPDPALDNETPDIHSDGVQLYLRTPGWTRQAAWLCVPDERTGRVRIRPVNGSRDDIPLRAAWLRTTTGYEMQLSVPLDQLGNGRRLTTLIDVIVNDMGPGRVRRRGQLVLSGGGGWIYLQGDRQHPSHFLPLAIDRD